MKSLQQFVAGFLNINIPLLNNTNYPAQNL